MDVETRAIPCFDMNYQYPYISSSLLLEQFQVTNTAVVPGTYDAAAWIPYSFPPQQSTRCIIHHTFTSIDNLKLMSPPRGCNTGQLAFGSQTTT
jgi:hypothetical protein